MDFHSKKNKDTGHVGHSFTFGVFIVALLLEEALINKKHSANMQVKVLRSGFLWSKSNK